jgi:adenylate cyclase
MTATRRLAAILAADVAGYSRLIGADEGGTLQALKAIRAELIDPTIAAHNGRLVKTTGDGVLIEFSSVVDALQCATQVQTGMVERNATTPANKRIEFRIGINVGDIVVEDGDIFGDGVNVAARLEGLAEPGGICVSARVQEDAAGKLDLAFEDMGEQQLKNIARPLRVYRIRADRVGEAAVGAKPSLALPDKPSIAVLPFANMSGDPEQEYFRRRHGRRDHHCALPYSLALRHRPQFEFYVQGPGDRCEASPPRTGCPLCPRRLGAQSPGPRPHHRAADRCAH